MSNLWEYCDGPVERMEPIERYVYEPKIELESMLDIKVRQMRAINHARHIERKVWEVRTQIQLPARRKNGRARYMIVANNDRVELVAILLQWALWMDTFEDVMAPRYEYSGDARIVKREHEVAMQMVFAQIGGLL